MGVSHPTHVNLYYIGGLRSEIIHLQGRSQEFAMGDKRWGLGDGSPQRGAGAEPRWGSGGKAPEAGDKC